MILHSLRVTHWRNLLNRAQVEPFSEGLNVIHAPNGTGKSSLFEAMRCALFDSHYVSCKEIEAVRPWGRQLMPQAVVEFTKAGVRYKIEKAFLDGAGSRLFRFEAGTFVPLAEGRNADSKVREILAATDAPGRGLSKQEHWGISQVLWAPQGNLRIAQLSSSVSENVRRSLGVQLAGDGGCQMDELLEQEFSAVFAKGGKLRAGKQAPPITGLETQMEQLKAELLDLRYKQQAFEETARLVEDARQRRTQSRIEAEGLTKPLEQARKDAQAYQDLQRELAAKRDAEANAKDKYDAISQTIQLVAKARNEVAELSSQIKTKESQVSTLETEVRAAGNHLESCRSERELRRQERPTLDALTTELADARSFLTYTTEQSELDSKLRKLARLKNDLQTKKDARAKVVAPDTKTIEAVRRLLNAREAAATKMNANLVRLTIRPLKSVKVQRIAPEDTRDVAAGKLVTFTGSPHIKVEVEGFGSIHATGPEVDSDHLQRQVLETNKELAQLTQPYGTEDPDRLQVLRDNAWQLDHDVKHSEERFSEELGEDMLEKIQQRFASAEARVRELIKRHPAWEEKPPALGELQTALEEKGTTIQAAIQKAEDAFDQAQATHMRVDKQHEVAETMLKTTRIILTAAEERLTDLTKDGIPDNDRKTAMDEALMAWQVARNQAAECQNKLKELGDDRCKIVQMLEKQLKAFTDSELKARDAENNAQGKLQALAAEGTYTRLVAAEEKIADLTVRIARERLRIDALKLLHDTVAQCRTAVIAAVVAPVEQVATRMLSRVAGTRLGVMRMAPDFSPVGMQPASENEPIGLENLSGGEQEQLYLVTRLALASFLAKDERQLVVLDDVLNATDAGRLARILNLLEEAASSLQIVILTCHPERYRALESAKFFDLQESIVGI